MRPQRVQRCAVRRIVLTIRVVVQVACVTQSVRVQVFLHRVGCGRAVVYRIGHSIPVQISHTVHGAGLAALRSNALSISTPGLTVSEAGLPRFRVSAYTVAAPAAVHVATLRRLSAAAYAVAAGAHAVPRTLLHFVIATHAVTAPGTIGGTTPCTLAGETKTITTWWQAVRRAKHWAFAETAYSITAGRRTIAGADVHAFVQAAKAVTATATVNYAELSTLPALAHAVAARGQAVRGTRTSIQAHLVGAADAVPARTAIYGTKVSGVRILAFPISAHGLAAQGVVTRHAHSLVAVVIYRALFLVITLHTIQGLVQTAEGWIARVHRAGIAVIAIDRRSANARTVPALVRAGAQVTVFANTGSGVKDAARCRLTGINGADVAIVALDLLGPRHAKRALASVTRCAEIAVFALTLQRNVQHLLQLFIAQVLGALLAVIQRRQFHHHASRKRVAHLHASAEETITAQTVLGRMLTLSIQTASIYRAFDTIIAGSTFQHTLPSLAHT